jgi:hypothetical protein
MPIRQENTLGVLPEVLTALVKQHADYSDLQRGCSQSGGYRTAADYDDVVDGSNALIRAQRAFAEALRRARCSADSGPCVLPRWAIDMRARASADTFRPLLAAEILALASGE